MSIPLTILEPWIPLAGLEARAWEDEYAREVSKGHPLYGVPAKALAYERVWGIFRLFRHESKDAVIELTFSGREERAPQAPTFVLYRDKEHLMTEYLSPQHRNWLGSARECIREQGHFSVFLAPHNYEIRTPLPAHETVLRALANAAEVCWVYGISPGSMLWSASSEILERCRGKHRLRSSLEVIHGHELLWNARGGKRGTVLFLVDPASLLSLGVFRNCSRPIFTENMGAGHTPSAVRLAKQYVRRAGVVALLLPRNNGIEWMDVLAAPELGLSLFDHAYSHNNGRHWNNQDSVVESRENGS